MKYAYGAVIAFLLASGSSSTPGVHVPRSRSADRPDSRTVRHAVLKRSVDDVDPNMLLQEYTDQINSLFEAYQNGLRLISAAVNAGKLTPEEGQALRLKGARIVVSRFQAITVLYDSLLTGSSDEDANPAESDEAPSGDPLIRIADRAAGKLAPDAFHGRVREGIPMRLHTGWTD